MRPFKRPKSKLPLYFNYKYDGFQVIHEIKDDGTIVLGGCCTFINDAYTCISRYTVNKSYLERLIRLNLRKIETYDFIKIYELYRDHITAKIDTGEDRTDLFYKDKSIIDRNYF
jgi:hypothetical protein